MAEDQCEDPQWDLKYRSEEEMDFFTEMALHETERWMEVCFNLILSSFNVYLIR